MACFLTTSPLQCISIVSFRFLSALASISLHDFPVYLSRRSVSFSPHPFRSVWVFVRLFHGLTLLVINCFLAEFMLPPYPRRTAWRFKMAEHNRTEGTAPGRPHQHSFAFLCISSITKVHFLFITSKYDLARASVVCLRHSAPNGCLPKSIVVSFQNTHISSITLFYDSCHRSTLFSQEPSRLHQHSLNCEWNI